MRWIVLVTIAVALFVPARAQSSASFRLEEHTFNAGGHPEDSTVLSSASFRISLDSLDDGARGRGLASASFHADIGLANAYPPPGEVTGLAFTDGQTLAWNADPSAGSYILFRDLLSNVIGGGFGNCEQQGLVAPTTTDTDPVPVDDGFFYLVTVVNRLAEQGTKGFQSGGAERQGNACP